MIAFDRVEDLEDQFSLALVVELGWLTVRVLDGIEQTWLDLLSCH